jgi:ABC-2 type transport system permease protein
MVMSMLGLMLPTILLSGFIFPSITCQKSCSGFSSIIPARYFIVIVKNIMLKGTGSLHLERNPDPGWHDPVFLFLLPPVRFQIRLK